MEAILKGEDVGVRQRREEIQASDRQQLLDRCVTKCPPMGHHREKLNLEEACSVGELLRNLIYSYT